MSSTGSKIDTLNKLRDQQRGHEEAIKQLAKERALIEAELMAQMDADGISKATGKTATASISETIRPNVEDWDTFYAYIHRNKYYHLLERRPSVSGCQELFETKGKVPGVVPFKQRRVNLRNL